MYLIVVSGQWIASCCVMTHHHTRFCCCTCELDTAEEDKLNASHSAIVAEIVPQHEIDEPQQVSAEEGAENVAPKPESIERNKPPLTLPSKAALGTPMSAFPLNTESQSVRVAEEIELVPARQLSFPRVDLGQDAEDESAQRANSSMVSQNSARPLSSAAATPLKSTAVENDIVRRAHTSPATTELKHGSGTRGNAKTGGSKACCLDVPGSLTVAPSETTRELSPAKLDPLPHKPPNAAALARARNGARLTRPRDHHRGPH